MSDSEFDVLDELYFVQSFDNLQGLCDLDTDELVKTLSSLFEKKWIKVLKTVDEEEIPDKVLLKTEYRKYFYLATKKGLLAHNSTS